MIEKMKALLLENDLCVLATCSRNEPHCSLMAYIADADGETLHMATLSTSRKYGNLIENRRVSLLIDTRSDQTQARDKLQALTVAGEFSPPQGADERKEVLDRIAARHPHLTELLNHPDAVVVSVRIESFLLLEGATEAHYEKVR